MASASDPCLALEAAALEKRQQLVNQALLDAFGGEAEDLPRIGLCLSGGGWRAMTSGCAFFDALSIPFKSTNSGKTVKPLDCVTHAVGLSGGSWLLFNTLAGAAAGKNAFHNTTDNPWLYGPEHSFKEGVHKYEGLQRMVNKEIVDKACHRSAFRKNAGFISSKVGADATIAAVLASKNLGSTLVERWSNFIANDLLGWLDDNYSMPEDVRQQLEAEFQTLNERLQREHQEYLEKRTITLGSGGVTVGGGKKDVERELERQRAILSAARHPSRTQSFSSLQRSVSEGKLPFIICAAIANKRGVTQEMIDEYEQYQEESEMRLMEQRDKEEEELAHCGSEGPPSPPPSTVSSPTGHKVFPRIYDWVEFCPFFVRNPYNNTYYLSPDELQGTFGTKDAPQPMKVHHLMGLCGSAFACDMSCALPLGVQKNVSKNREMSTTPLIGRGTTNISSEANTANPIGECRDAGIDFNIPLPAMLAEAQRQFDIIVVMDAGAGSKNAHELQRAVDLGFLEPMTNKDPEKKFLKGQYVQVYRNKLGGPTVIYFLGLCDRGTHQIICQPHIVEMDCKKLRERVIKQLVPVLATEIRRFQTTHCKVRTTGVSARDVLAEEDAAGSPTMNFALEEDDANEWCDDEEDALPDDETLSAEVRTLMLAAAATGGVRNGFDAFAAAEYNVLYENPLIQKELRGQSLAALQQAAVMMVLKNTTATDPEIQPIFDKIPGMTGGELAKFGILVPANAKVKGMSMLRARRLLLGTKQLLLSPPWRDYYAATGLAATTLTSYPQLLQQLHRHEGASGVNTALGNVPMSSDSKVWLHYVNCLKSLQHSAGADDPNTTAVIDSLLQHFVGEAFRSFERALAQRGQQSQQEFTCTLRNFLATAAQELPGVTAESIIAVFDRHQFTPVELGKAAEEAARAGNKDLLVLLSMRAPGFTDRSAVLANAYASSDDSLVEWLMVERKVQLDFVESCAKSYHEAVNELARLPQYQNIQAAATAAMQGHHEDIATILYNTGHKQYRMWLAQTAQQMGLPWDRLYVRAGIAQPASSGASSPKEKLSSSTQLAKETAGAAGQKAMCSFKAAASLGKGLFGKKK